MTKLSLQEFINEALKGNGVQNDNTDVWVEIDGIQYTVKIDEVLDHEEKEPFEASYTLEGDRKHDAWEELYRQYLKDESIK